MRNSFKNFIVNNSNKEAYELSTKIAKEEVKDANPLIIYGPTGCGKSHLLDGIWHHYVLNSENHPEWMSCHGFQTTIERYNNDVANISNFKEVSLLLLDDIDVVEDKQNGKFVAEVLKKLIQDGKQICLTCTKLPDVNDKPELANLFSKGKCVGLSLPTSDEQKEFYKQMSKVQGVDIHGEEPYEYLCQMQKDYRTMKSEFAKLRYCLIRDNIETASLSVNLIKKYLEN